MSRRWAREDESVVDMAEAASRKALEAAGLDASRIGAVLVATVTHPFQTPTAAALLTHRLGATPAAAMDVAAACAGFCHALALAGDMVTGGSAEHVLVVGVDKPVGLHRPRRPRHRVHLRRRRRRRGGRPVRHPRHRPDGLGLGRRAVGHHPPAQQWLDDPTSPDFSSAFSMKGQAVFRWAVWQMAPVAQQALEKAGVSADDLDAFIPHQANMRIVDSLCKTLKPARARARRARHRRDRQHVVGVHPARDGADAPRG
ncbi:hypothetical protein GCM10025868_45880 [Angustibacter aerolatus]|uniref:Beta-ketoacyl-[acyl-carrier-protein] synthase III N-terminal domain-containing protein n=1 Tax=Angustibacter aerolatus TaxID=1162965 RepID=A0ABQ6JM60_9ACTN|nr:hypothetical protein GCM10025868_45880 [Angustibacter aerolatus]